MVTEGQKARGRKPVSEAGPGVFVGVRLPRELVPRIDAIASAATSRNLVERNDAITTVQVTRSEVIRALIETGLLEAEALLGIMPEPE